MKIRIKGNSLRLRLLQSEVALFEQQGWVSESIQFGPEATQKLTYTLQIDDGNELRAQYTPGSIEVRVPRSLADHWVSTEEVSIKGAMPISDTAALSLLIEKDFQCTKVRPGEDESDNYPHPGFQ